MLGLMIDVKIMSNAQNVIKVTFRNFLPQC